MDFEDYSCSRLVSSLFWDHFGTGIVTKPLFCRSLVQSFVLTVSHCYLEGHGDLVSRLIAP